MSLENQNGYKNGGMGRMPIPIGGGDVYIPPTNEAQDKYEHIDYHKSRRPLGIAAVRCYVPEFSQEVIQDLLTHQSPDRSEITDLEA